MVIHSNGKAKMDNVMAEWSGVERGQGIVKTRYATAERSGEQLWQSKDLNRIGKALSIIATAKQ
jgi:hypothetical protein